MQYTDVMLTRALFALPRSLEGECNDHSDDSDDGGDTSKSSSETLSQSSLGKAARSPFAGSETSRVQGLDYDDGIETAGDTQGFRAAFDASHEHPTVLRRLFSEPSTEGINPEFLPDFHCCERDFEDLHAFLVHYEAEHSYNLATSSSILGDDKKANDDLHSTLNATKDTLFSLNSNSLLDSMRGTPPLEAYRPKDTPPPPEDWTPAPFDDHQRFSPVPSDSTDSIKSNSNLASQSDSTVPSQTPRIIAGQVLQGLYKCPHPGCHALPFATPYLLNSHRNVHSSDRPYHCQRDDCPRSKTGKGFKRKNEMLRHMLIHESPGYVCPFCSPEKEHRYPRPNNLQRHVKMHHEDKAEDDPKLLEVLGQRRSTVLSAAEMWNRARSGGTTQEQKRPRSPTSVSHKCSSSRHTSPPARSLDKFEKIYKCTWNGCGRHYRKLSHLNAHVELRSHGSFRNVEGKADLPKHDDIHLHPLPTIGKSSLVKHTCIRDRFKADQLFPVVSRHCNRELR